MADTIREKIIAAICAGVEDISIENGYNTDAGKFVKRGQRIVDQDQFPAIAVMPFIEENEPLPGKNNLSMRVRVDGALKFGSQNPSIMAEKLLGDIIYRMTNTSLDSIHGGYAVKVQYAEGGIDDYPEPGQYSVAVHATFNISYKTKLGNPYNQ